MYYKSRHIPLRQEEMVYLCGGIYYSRTDGRLYIQVGNDNNNYEFVLNRKGGFNAQKVYRTFTNEYFCKPFFSPLVAFGGFYLRELQYMYPYEEAICSIVEHLANRFTLEDLDFFLRYLLPLDSQIVMALLANKYKQPTPLSSFARIAKSIACAIDSYDPMQAAVTYTLLPDSISSGTAVPFFYSAFETFYQVSRMSNTATYLIPRRPFNYDLKTQEGLAGFLMSLIYYQVSCEHLRFLNPEVELRSFSSTEIYLNPEFRQKIASPLHNEKFFPNILCESPKIQLEDGHITVVSFLKLYIFCMKEGRLSPLKYNDWILKTYFFLSKNLGSDLSPENCARFLPLFAQFLLKEIPQIAIDEDGIIWDQVAPFDWATYDIAQAFLKQVMVGFPLAHHTPILGHFSNEVLEKLLSQGLQHKEDLQERVKVGVEVLKPRLSIYESLVEDLASCLNK